MRILARFIDCQDVEQTALGFENKKQTEWKCKTAFFFFSFFFLLHFLLFIFFFQDVQYLLGWLGQNVYKEGCQQIYTASKGHLCYIAFYYHDL